MKLTNRVASEVEKWRSVEERLSKLFSSSPSFQKVLDKEKIRYYGEILSRHKSSKIADDRRILRMIQQEKTETEKRLYPNVLKRLLQRLLIAPLLRRLSAAKAVKLTEKNLQSLTEQIYRAGFSGLFAKVDEKIRQGHEQFTVPVSYYINERERIDHNLSFASDAVGQYRFEGFRTSLHLEAKPKEVREHYFSARGAYEVNKTESCNLLAGRAVHKDGKWIQFDINDKDVQGNYRLKEFHSGYGYDLEKTVGQLPLKEPGNKIEMEALYNSLKQGNRQCVSFVKDGGEQQYHIEANPQFKSVIIYDSHLRKISLTTALSAKGEALKPAHKTSVQEDTKQARAAIMRIR